MISAPFVNFTVKRHVTWYRNKYNFVNTLWHQRKTWLHPYVDIQHLFDLEHVIVRYLNQMTVLENLIILRTKYIAGLKPSLKAECDLEKWIAVQNGLLGSLLNWKKNGTSLKTC